MDASADLRRIYTAIHEAAHAVVEIVLGSWVQSVDIIARDADGHETLGCTDVIQPEVREILGDEETILRRMAGLLAGMAAELRAYPESPWGYFRSDIEMAVLYNQCYEQVLHVDHRGKLCLGIYEETEDEQMERLKRAFGIAAAVVNHRWQLILRIAALLLEHESISGCKVLAIVRSGHMRNHKRSGPRRFQQRRDKGWSKPTGGRCVSRPSRYGSPFPVPAEWRGDQLAHADAVGEFREWITSPPQSGLLDEARRELRGLDLGCYCPIDVPCHADVLLELVNGD